MIRSTPTTTTPRDTVGCSDGYDTAYITVAYDSTGKITAADKVYNCEKVIVKNSAGTLEELNQAYLPQNQTHTSTTT
jgi:hypothetical protein